MVEVTFNDCDYGCYQCKIIDHAGDPLVCSAVSALGMTLVGALQSIEGITFNALYHGEGHINVEINPFIDEEKQTITDTIFRTIYIGLKQLEVSYPQNIKVTGII